MFDVFLSHNSHDKPAVEVLAARLRAEASLRPFLDTWHLVPGEQWQPCLEQALAESASVAVFFGPCGISPWHHEEIRLALAQAVRTHDECRVIPVLLPGAEPEDVTGFLTQRTWVDFRTGLDDDAAFRRLVAGIKGQAPEGDSYQLPDEPAPYRGLLPFGQADAPFFFGRDAEIALVRDKLKQHPFVAVVGASGVGKSSLVLGGVLPRLQSSAVGLGPHLRIRKMTPGGAPLRALADQLATLVPPEARLATADALTHRLAACSNGLRTAAATLTADAPGPLLLVVDQLEELFTYGTHGSISREAEAFLSNLEDAVQRGDGALRVIVTLRADFFGCCLRVPLLRALLQDHQVLLGGMRPEALREAIIRPAQAVGALLEKGLLGVILKDVSQEPGALPLLEHALYELWRARSGAWLTLSAYEASGGVGGALQRRAQATYEALGDEARELTRKLFLRLTAVGEGTVAIRRRIARGELAFPGTPPEQVEHVLQVLSGPEARLIVADADTVEVAHEALIQQWPTLRRWVAENGRGLFIHRQLTQAANAWAEHHQDSCYLYTGSRLLEAEECFAASPGPLNQRERDFLEASLACRDGEQRARERQRQEELERARQLAQEAEARRKAEAERARAARRATRRLRGLALVLAVAAVGIFSFWRQAQRQRDTALSRELMANAILGLKEDPQRSLLLIQEAHRLAPTEHVTRAFSAWLLEPGLVVLRDSAHSMCRAQFSPDGTRILTASKDGTARLWDATSGRHLATFSGHTGSLEEARFSPDGARILTASKDGTARLWDATGRLLFTLSGHTGPLAEARFSPDSSRIVTASQDGTARIWEAASGQPLVTLSGHAGPISDATFSPDGARVLTVSDDGAARLWDAASGRLLFTLLGHTSPVKVASLSPDGARVVTASWDGTVRLWDATSGRLRATLLGHTGTVREASFSPDGTRVVTASDDGTARLWDVASGRLLVTLSGHTNTVWDASFSPDGVRIVTASRDGTARVWDAVSGQTVMTFSGHTGEVWRASFSSEGTRVVTVSEDGTARVWDAIGKVSTTLPGNRVDFSPDGARAVTVSRDGTARTWDMASGRPLVTFSGHSGEVWDACFSPDGARIATASLDGTARLWDAVSGQSLVVLQGHTGAVWGASFSPDGARIATASEDGTARLWDAVSGRLLTTLKGHTHRVWHASFSSDGLRIATSSDDGTARLWDAASGQLLLTLSGHEGEVWDVSFSPDGTRVITTSRDGTARLWNADSGQPLITLFGQAGPMEDAMFSPDGARVITTSFDDVPRIWDALSGELLGTLLGETQVPLRARLSSEGTRVFTITDNGTVHLWASRLEEPIEAQLSRWKAHRDLTCEEREKYLHEKRSCSRREGSSMSHAGPRLTAG
jgi:WD40 repeat protein